MSVVTGGVGLVLLAAVLLGGCAGLSSATPFNPAQSCQAVGGTYYNGQCHAGNAFLSPAPGLGEVDDEGGVVGRSFAPPGMARPGESRQQVRIHEGLIDPEAIAAVG